MNNAWQIRRKKEEKVGQNAAFPENKYFTKILRI
ncbi:hypothetical protein LEMLEM_LOCUS12565 [Lemmus lemmus]